MNFCYGRGSYALLNSAYNTVCFLYHVHEGCTNNDSNGMNIVDVTCHCMSSCNMTSNHILLLRPDVGPIQQQLHTMECINFTSSLISAMRTLVLGLLCYLTVIHKVSSLHKYYYK